MATVKQIAVANADAASNTSLTSAFAVDGDFSHYFVAIPTTVVWSVTGTGGIGILGSPTETGTFRQVAFSSNPATATTGSADWISGNDAGNKMIICEALQFVPGWAKIQFTNTATAATEFVIYGRKFD